jgi:cytochrome c5
MKKISILLSVATLSACSAKLLTPTQKDVERVSNKYSGYTLAELTEGKTNFQQNCGKCHGLKNPTSRTEAQWDEIVPRMVKKINKKSEVVNAKTQESILKYLITMSTVQKAQ